MVVENNILYVGDVLHTVSEQESCHSLSRRIRKDWLSNSLLSCVST